MTDIDYNLLTLRSFTFGVFLARHEDVRQPCGGSWSAILRETSQRNEAAVFIDDELRQRLLRAVFEACYAEIHPQQMVFDTNRQWTTKLPALTRLFPMAKMICCVRNPAWIIDSIESLIRRNAFELSGIFSYDPGGTVYSRVEGLASPTGMVGFALNALREAVYGEFGDGCSWSATRA